MGTGLMGGGSEGGGSEGGGSMGGGSEGVALERAVVSAITSDRSEAKVTVVGVPDQPGVAARLFRALAEASVNVDMIVQNVSLSGVTEISFTVPQIELVTAERVTRAVAGTIGAREVTSDAGIGRVSLVGGGMKTHPGVAATVFEVMAEAGINIEMISTSSIRISCVVRVDSLDRAVRALHQAFDLHALPGAS
ncbi:MAG: ACT domain-containing protein [Acidimicrobiales bacterium]